MTTAPTLSRAPTTKVPKRSRAVTYCAVCRYSYADRERDGNYYHEECLTAIDREWHAVPKRLTKEGLR